MDIRHTILFFPHKKPLKKHVSLFTHQSQTSQTSQTQTQFNSYWSVVKELLQLMRNKTDFYLCSYCNSGILVSYCGGGVMGSMLTGFCVGLRIWRRKSFRCSLSDLILLTRRGRSKRLARLLLRVGRLAFGARPGRSLWVWSGGCAGAGAVWFRGVSSVALLMGSLPSFSTAAMMSSQDGSWEVLWRRLLSRTGQVSLPTTSSQLGTLQAFESEVLETEGRTQSQ